MTLALILTEEQRVRFNFHLQIIFVSVFVHSITITLPLFRKGGGGDFIKYEYPPIIYYYFSLEIIRLTLLSSVLL